MKNSLTPSRIPRRQTGGGTPKQRTPARRGSYAAAMMQPRGTPLRPHCQHLNAYASVQSPKPPLKPNNNQIALEEEAIQAIVRLRPLNSKESKDRRIWKLLHEDSAIALTKPTGEPLDKYVDSQNYFTIDKPFGEDATTRDVYDGCVLGIVTSVCAGLNGTIFAYGQTSSGKTFTMQGSGTIQQGSESEHASGIIHMAAQDIFKHIDSRPDRLFMVRASFLEVYNEEVRDLLSDVSSKLKVQESNGVVTTECKEVPVSDWKSLLEILAQGEQSRTFASTAMNERSSRSHTIFRVTLESRSKGEEEEHDGTSLISTLNLVDLAGSESVRHTGATGERQVEGAKINKSLLTLYRVIDALATGKTHVAYRESNLTRLLQSSLSGNARMAFICCATPSENYLEETRSTLRFAANAKMVKTRPKVNMVLDDKSRIRQLEKDLAESLKQCAEANRKLDVQVTSDTALEYAAHRKKVSQITSIILNYNRVPSEAALQSKRRLSDGLTFPRDELESRQAAASLTQPRPSKRAKGQKLESLASTFELSLTREALALKSQALQLSARNSEELQESLASSLARTTQVENLLSSELESLRKDFEQAVSEREAGKVTIQGMIESASSERQALQERQHALERTNEELQRQIVQMKAALEQETIRHEQEKNQIVEQRDSAERSREDLEQKAESLVSDLAASRSEHEELLAQCLSVEQEFAVVKKELEITISLSKTLEEENAAMKASRVEETSRFEAEKLKLQEEVTTLLHSKGAMEKDFEILKEELSALAKERDTLSGELGALTSAHLALQAATKEQEGRMSDRTKELATTRKLLTEATEQAVSIQKKLEAKQCEAKDAIENLMADLGKAKEDSNSALESLDVMQGHCNSVTLERDSIKSTLEEVNNRLALALKAEKEQKADLVSLQDSKSDLELKLSAMESEMQRSKLERDEIERRCSEAQNELDRLVSEKNELQTDHKKLRREFDSLEAKWAQLNNDYSSSQESLSSKTKALESTTQSVLQHKQRSEELSEEIGKLKEALRACQSALDFANEDVLKTRSADESKERMLVAKSREIETLLTEAQEMTGKMNLSQRDLAAARLEIDDLAKLKVELELSLSTIKESQAELTAAHEVIRCQYKSARDDIDRLKSELSEKDGLLEEVMKQKASMQEQVDKLSASERDLIQSNTDFQDRIKTLVNELSEARSSAETDRTHCTELTLALNSASKSRTLIETELADAMAANEDLQGRVSVLQADCEKLTADLKSSEIRLEDAQRKITRLEDLDGAKVEQNGILENQITVLQAEIRDTKNRQCELEDSLKTARSSVTSLKCSVSSLENEKAELLHEADQRKDEANGLNSEVERLKAQIETDIAQEIDLKNELDTARGMLETAKLELCEKQASINDLEAGLTSMSNMMKERNAQLDVKTSKISELEQCLATKTELEASPDLIDSLNAQVESLKNESSEVKLLLANANNEVDLARDRAVLLQRELDELELRYDFEKRSFEDAKNKSLTPELEQLRAEKAEVERALEKEVADRFQSESVWKSRLEEARKSLIEEAESHMHNLQVELRTTKESLKQAEDEAYAGRQEYQELLEREVDARAKLTELKRENDRLKSTFDQLSQDRMSESSKLATNLQVAKADETVLKKKVSDLKQKLREAIDANKKFAADSTQLKALKVTNASLRRELEAVTSSEKGSDDALAKLSDQLRVKDERIQKLEMMKFTKEHAESLKNLKASKSEFEKENKILRQRLEGLLAAETESADVTQLRFDKAASESKYRKLLHRCQELEEEKGTCLAVLRRNQQSIDDKDFVECIVSVCDQLTSDLSQRSSLSSELEDAVKAKRLLETTVRDQSLLIESLQTEREKSSLVSGRIQDLQDKLHHLEQENFTLMTEKKELKKKCQKTLKELTVLRTKVSDGDDVTMDLQRLKQNVATSKPADNNRGLHNLERKHASSTSLATSSPYASRALKQRQVDTKPPRQQHHTDLQSEAPSPLDLLCSNFATSATGSGRKPDVTVNDENARNRDVFSLDNITGSSSKSKQRSAPELGESHPAAASNENTADCAQS